MNKILVSSILTLAAPIALSANAYLFSFEDVTAIEPAFTTSTSTFQLSSTGVTEGSFALEVTSQEFWDFQINLPDPGAFWAALGNEGLVYVDITSNEATGNTGFWGELTVALQGDGVGWTQLSSVGIWDTDGDTLTLDFSTVDLSGAGMDWAQIIFSFNANNGTTHYVDNLVVIPEPSQTAAALGLVALAALIYVRRRRA